MKTRLQTTGEKSWLKDVLHIHEDYTDYLTVYRSWGGIHFRKARAVDHCLASLQPSKLFSPGSSFRKECHHGRFYTMTKTADFSAG